MRFMALPFLNKMLVPPFPNEVLPRPLPARSPSKNNIKIIIVRPKVEARDHARSRCQPRDTSKDTGTYTRRVDDTQPTSCSPDHSVQSEARRDPTPGRGFALAIHSPGTTNLATPSLFSSSLKLQSGSKHDVTEKGPTVRFPATTPKSRTETTQKTEGTEIHALYFVVASD